LDGQADYKGDTPHGQYSKNCRWNSKKLPLDKWLEGIIIQDSWIHKTGENPMKKDNKSTENDILKSLLLAHYNQIALPGNIYAFINVTLDGKVVLTGTFQNYYVIRDCYHGDNLIWSDMVDTVDGDRPDGIGEQHEFEVFS
jgi:hypothetical protein